MPNKNIRDQIKWLPFNSVIAGNKVIDEISREKNKQQMPLLSDEQKKIISDNILISFHNNEKVLIHYFYAGKIYSLFDTIKKIDSLKQKIYFNDKVIYFDQIIQAII